MNKSIKLILLIVGIVLVGYGIYMVVAPETAVELGPLSVEGQDNTSAYIAIGLGLAALLGSLVGGSKR